MKEAVGNGEFKEEGRVPGEGQVLVISDGTAELVRRALGRWIDNFRSLEGRSEPEPGASPE